MAKSSINFKAVKANSKVHNERLKEYDYVYSDLTENNEAWKSSEIIDKQKEIANYCKKVSGRKLQKNAEPIREAVVNLNPHHTMKDLRKLASELKEQKGIECFQIFIHRDEGKSREDLNLHAHMVFDWQDKTNGKMKRLNRIDMSEMQTIVAKSLGMERGELKENSNRERLESVEYKRQQEQLRLQELQQQVALEQKKNTAAEREHEKATSDLKGSLRRERKISQKVSNWIGLPSKRKLMFLAEQLNSNKAGLISKQENIKTSRAVFEKLKEQYKRLKEVLKPENFQELSKRLNDLNQRLKN